MELVLARYTNDEDSTGGLLFVNRRFFCYTCEDEAREVKVAGETRIPAGEYQIKLRNEGGMTKRYATRFGGNFHKGMLHLQDVPGFEYIYIHVGNTADHTEGCILVGFGANRTKHESTVTGSVNAYKVLYRMIVGAIEKGEEVKILVEELQWT